MHTPRCLQYRLNHSRLYYTTLDNVSQSLCFLPSCLFLCGRDQSAAHFRLEILITQVTQISCVSSENIIESNGTKRYRQDGTKYAQNQRVVTFFDRTFLKSL